MTTIVFPGQGSQFIGMSKDFYDNFKTAKQTFNLIEDISKIKISEIIFKDTSNLINITQYTQLAIFCSSIAIFNVLKDECDIDKIKFDYMLGHSLGEYTALTASNVFSVEDCTNLLKIRGELMHNAYETNKSGMAAIIGLECSLVENIISENHLSIEIANDNSPMQIVISGIKENLISLKDLFILNGAKKFIILNVSAAFHSKIMVDAEKKMSSYIDKISFKSPLNNIISNYSAINSNDKNVLKKNLSKQMSNRVRWVESIKCLERTEEKSIIEIGPGKILSGLIKRISNKFDIINIDNVDSFKKFINEF